jgi:hypothetical protein
MYAIGKIDFDGNKQNKFGVLIQSEAVPANPIRYIIGNFEQYRHEISKISIAIGCALFNLNPADQFAYYVPMEKIEQAFEQADAFMAPRK